MFKVIYYYYYLFYSRILREDDPHIVTTFALSVSEVFFVMYLIDLIWIKFFCEFLLG